TTPNYDLTGRTQQEDRRARKFPSRASCHRLASPAKRDTMLTSTFCHIPGVGERTERSLWSAGITCWDSLTLENGALPRHSLRSAWIPHIRESLSHHTNGNASYFYERLPSNQQWRLFRDFQNSCAFI